MRDEGGPGERSEAQVHDLLAAGFGRLEALIPQGLADERGARLDGEMLGVEYEIVEQRVVHVDLIEELHAGRPLAVAMPHVIEARLMGQPLLVLEALRAPALGRRRTHTHHVRDLAQHDRGRAPGQHDVVARGHLEHDRLDVRLVAMLRIAEALPERGLLLDAVAQVHHVLTELLGSLRDDLPVGELPAEALGQLASDLYAEAARGLGNGHDAHYPPPSRVNARNTNAPASHRVADEGSEGLSRRLIRGHVASLERALDRRSSAQSRSRRNGCQGDAPASPHPSASGPAVRPGRGPPPGPYSGRYPRRWD